MTSLPAPEARGAAASAPSSEGAPSRLRDALLGILESSAEQRWAVLFALLLAARAASIFVLWGPMDHVFSDPARHLDNARHFLKPGPMGCSNPYFYQLFLYLVLKVTHEKKVLLNIVAAALCAAYPYVWYRFARLMMKARVNALRFASFISVIPTQAVIFQYFMNETMILPMLGCALWASASAAKHRSGWRFLLATVLWTCTILSRSIAVPLSIVTLTWALFHVRSQRLRPLFYRPILVTVASLLAGTGIWIAAQHSLPIFEYATPFGDNETVSLYFVSGKKIYETTYTKPKHWTYTYGFSSPSLYINPFYPFKGFESIRQGTFKYTANVELHGKDLRELWKQQVLQNKKLFPRLIFENFVVLAFGHTWPESGLDSPQGLICTYERWIWLPITLLALYMSLRFIVRERRLAFVPAFGLFAIAVLYGSQLAVMEGRYRKPVEPVMCIAIAWALDARRAKQAWATLRT
jgi:hypothetical protein